MTSTEIQTFFLNLFLLTVLFFSLLSVVMFLYFALKRDRRNSITENFDVDQFIEQLVQAHVQKNVAKIIAPHPAPPKEAPTGAATNQPPAPPVEISADTPPPTVPSSNESLKTVVAAVSGDAAPAAQKRVEELVQPSASGPITEPAAPTPVSPSPEQTAISETPPAEEAKPPQMSTSAMATDAESKMPNPSPISKAPPTPKETIPEQPMSIPDQSPSPAPNVSSDSEIQVDQMIEEALTVPPSVQSEIQPKPASTPEAPKAESISQSEATIEAALALHDKDAQKEPTKLDTAEPIDSANQEVIISFEEAPPSPAATDEDAKPSPRSEIDQAKTDDALKSLLDQMTATEKTTAAAVVPKADNQPPSDSSKIIPPSNTFEKNGTDLAAANPTASPSSQETAPADQKAVDATPETTPLIEVESTPENGASATQEAVDLEVEKLRKLFEEQTPAPPADEVSEIEQILYQMGPKKPPPKSIEDEVTRTKSV